MDATTTDAGDGAVRTRIAGLERGLRIERAILDSLPPGPAREAQLDTVATLAAALAWERGRLERVR